MTDCICKKDYGWDPSAYALEISYACMKSFIY